MSWHNDRVMDELESELDEVRRERDNLRGLLRDATNALEPFATAWKRYQNVLDWAEEESHHTDWTWHTAIDKPEEKMAATVQTWERITAALKDATGKNPVRSDVEPPDVPGGDR